MSPEEIPHPELEDIVADDPDMEMPLTARTNTIIRNHVVAATAAGFVPMPVFDIGAVTAVQLKMLHSLAGAYEIPFKRDMGKSVIASLVSTIGGNALARGSFGSMVKIIPVIGTFVGSITVPIFAGATTYAVGKIFQQHFAAGGTFLDFDPDEVTSYFREKYKEGQAVADGLKDKVDPEMKKKMADLAQRDDKSEADGNS